MIATAEQPLTITANARIDGREELIAKLRLSPKQSPTDTELILYAYEAWGEDCVQHLIGDFAFAIHDRRSRRVFCARDHFGVKPFFYTRTANGFSFSTALDALRLEADVSNTLNEIAIGDYLLFGVNQDLSTTTFRDIQRLPPGHTLTISNESTTMRRYWRPESITETRFRDRASYVERFSELLTRAVKDRLSTNRVAISMSGGLDSTSIAAIARDRASTHAFTVVYDSLIPDRERYYSTAAAEHLNIPITHLSGDRFSLFDEQVHGDMDQPEPFLLSPLTAQYHGLLRLCASFAPVALSGWDGDALMNEPRRSRLRIRSRFRRLLGKGSQDASLPEWIDESFAERTHLHDRLQAPSRSPVHAHASALRALDSKVWTALFEGYDPSATRLNLEVRHPLIDVRVVEYLLSIPPEPWCSNKHILRCAMKDRLPQVVLNRRKTALAGDPALQLTRGGGVRWLDSFEVNPQLKGFVNLDHRRPVADELTPDAIWASLRVFALNHWLSHSQPPDRLTKERPRAYKISIA